MHIYLRHVILVCLIILGLAPLVAQITINRPEVLLQVQGYAERQKLHRLESEETILDNRLGYVLDVMRLAADLPAPLEILGLGKSGQLDPGAATERFANAMKRWFINRPGLWSLRIVNLEGREKLRLHRSADGSLQRAVIDLEDKKDELYMVSGTEDYHITQIAPNRRFGEAERPDELTLQVALPIRRDTTTVGFMVFTVGAHALLHGYQQFPWYSGAGELIQAGSGDDGDKVDISSPRVEAILKAGRPAVVPPDVSGTRQGWLPVQLAPDGAHRVWIVLPLEVDIIESWLSVFNHNTIILFSVILVVVFLVATALMLVIEGFVQRLLRSVKAILEERNPAFRFGPFGEMKRLADGLSDLARQHRQDIDARSVAEVRLTESRNRIELLLRSASESIIGVDINGRITFCNPSALTLLGFSAEHQLQGRRFSTMMCDDALEDSICSRLHGSELTKHIHLGQVGIRRYDASTLPVEFWSHPIIAEGKTEGAVFTLVDISVRQQVQEELSRLRTLLTNIVDSMPSALIGVDARLCVTQWNRAAEALFGVTTAQATGHRIDDACLPLACEVDRIKASLNDQRTDRATNLPLQLNGEERFVDVTTYPLVGDGVEGAVVLVDDITERMRLEEIMVQSEKMLSVGGLAAGMAHEINNPLAGILQNVQVLRNRLQPDLPANQRTAREVGASMELIQAYAEKRGLFTMVDSVMESGRRAAKVVENMLSFSRKSESTYAPHDLAKLLDQSLELAGNDYDLKKKYDFRQIEILRDYQADAPKVACEDGQIQQVIINLLRNACQAMAGQADSSLHPRITLRLARREDTVCIEIEDNGPGIDKEVGKRVFEPFFTTKAVGVGTGLGLSVSYFIVTENHGGSMNVESVPGQGTRFIICLPIEKATAPTDSHP